MKIVKWRETLKNEEIKEVRLKDFVDFAVMGV